MLILEECELKSDLYLKQGPRKSRFSLNVANRQAYGFTDGQLQKIGHNKINVTYMEKMVLDIYQEGNLPQVCIYSAQRHTISYVDYSDALKSVMCDIIKIRLKRRIASRSGKENQPLNIKTAVERPILKLGLPNFSWSFYFLLFLVAFPLFRLIFMTSHMTLSSASLQLLEVYN